MSTKGVYICTGDADQSIDNGVRITARSHKEAAEIAGRRWYGKDVAESGRGKIVEVYVVAAKDVEALGDYEDEFEALGWISKDYCIPIHAPEPECEGGDHDWRDVGTWDTGEEINTIQACTRCGIQRRILPGHDCPALVLEYKQKEAE